ncbi:MAG: LamG domain-containing protein [Nanoarchaeota archaeon]|nr:LamG domain-containing protein [Nanoarchaeota archaeon]
MEKINILILVFLFFCLPLVLAAPSVSFTFPTPNDGLVTTNTSIEINISIVEPNLGSLIYNWNGTNFSLYDGNLMLIFNFDKELELISEDSSWDDNLMSVWHLNSDSTDSKGSNDGTASAGVTCNGNVGKFVGGCEFDGVADNITIANEENFDFESTDNFSTCFWASFDTFAGNKVHTPLSKLLNSGLVTGWEIHTWDNSGTVGDAISIYLVEDWWTNKCIFATAANILAGTEGQWQHICITYNGSNTVSGVKIYQNGVSKSVASGGYCTTPPSGSIKNNVPLLIGEREISFNTLDGKMDEVAIWNRTLTLSEIQEIYSKGLAEDKSKYSNNGTIVSVTNTTGKYSGGFQFDGVNDYLSIPQTFFDSETFSLWVKTTDTGPLMTWSQGDLNGYYDRTITINSAATANVSWYIWNKATIYSDKNVNDGNWHHIATTGNITEMNIYIDGVLSSSRVADSRSDAVSDTHITIAGGATGYLNATIDEVRVWNRSLSNAEIYQLYVSNLQKFNQTQWYLYVNQSKNATDGLDLGAYTYQTFATNSSGSLNSTDLRTLTITSDATFPLINFTSPTPANATSTTNTSIEINVSIVEENLNEVIWNWNGTNFTIFNDSLVLMMNFDNRSSLGENDTYVVDYSTSQENGNAIGNAIYTPSGKYGGAFDFDGDGDYINISTGFGITNKNVAVFLWVNLDSVNEQGAFVYFGDPGHGIGVGANGHFDTPGGGNELGLIFEGVRWITQSTSIGTGWHYVGYVLDSSGYPTIYLDGKSIYSDSGDLAWVPTPSVTKIGGYPSGGTRFADCTIDEVRIWNRSLTADEIYQQYASNLNKFNSTQWNLYVNQSKNATIGLEDGNYTYQTFAQDDAENLNMTDLRTVTIDTVDRVYPELNFTSPTPANATSTTNTSVEINFSIIEENLDDVIWNWNGTNFTMYNDSLVLMMNFDNRSSLGENDTYVVDMSGNGNNGILGGTAKFNATSKFGNALWLDGNSDYVEVIDSSSLDLGTDSMTIVAWVYPKTFGDTDEIVKKDNSYILRLSGTSGAVEGYLWADTNVNRVGPSTNLLVQNSWNHVAMIYNTTTQQLFINGIADATDPQTGNVDNSAINLMIGSHQDKAQEFFDGGIDELRIWNRALSAEEIYQQYVSNLNKFNLTQWYLYVNQSKNATGGLDVGDYTYQVFAKDDAGNLNFTDLRTVIITASSSGCPATPQNWNINLADNLLINSLCNLTGYNVTFTGTGDFTVNNSFYFNEMNNLSSGMTVWVKPNGILYSGAT